MKQAYTVQHNEHVTTRGFDDVVRIFESALGSVENGGLQAAVSSARSLAEFEDGVRSREGSSGFMRLFGNGEVAEAAKKLDAKLAALALHATGSEA